MCPDKFRCVFWNQMWTVNMTLIYIPGKNPKENLILKGLQESRFFFLPTLLEKGKKRFIQESFNFDWKAETTLRLKLERRESDPFAKCVMISFHFQILETDSAFSMWNPSALLSASFLSTSWKITRQKGEDYRWHFSFWSDWWFLFLHKSPQFSPTPNFPLAEKGWI